MRRLTSSNFFRPYRYDLDFVVASLQFPKTLLIESIYLKPASKFSNAPTTTTTATHKNEDDKNVFRLHAAAQTLNIKHIFGAKITSPAPIDKVAPEDQDVVTFELLNSNSSNEEEERVIHLVIETTVNQTAMRGLYEANYTVENKNSTTMLKKTTWGSHMEPIAARSTFACVDEPNARADYAVSYLFSNTAENKDLVCISGGRITDVSEGDDNTSLGALVKGKGGGGGGEKTNEDEQQQLLQQIIKQWMQDAFQQKGKNNFADFDITPLDEKKPYRRVHFDVLPWSPPYLTAFTIGDYDHVVPTKPQYVSKKSNKEIPIKFYFARGRDPATAQFACDVIRFALEFYEEWFDHPYVLPKLDCAAIPDFAIGGQENQAAIFLTERVLCDPKTTAVSRLKVIVDLCSHEVSHMWFGGIVGLSDWSQLWLKEGFASFFGCFACDVKEPTWEAFAAMTDDLFDALDVDGHVATHPVEVEITDPSLITQMFDSLSYNKGLSLVRFLQSYLGADSFQRAIRFYINKFKHSNTTTPQLWQAIEEATGQPVQDMMRCFTQQPGYPVVSCSLLSGKGADGGGGAFLKLTQSPFALAAAASTPDATNASKMMKWTIPIDMNIVGSSLSAVAGNEKLQCVIAESETEKTIQLSEAQLNKLQNSSSSSSCCCLAVNTDHNGFFRVQYDFDLFEKLLANYDSLSDSFRTGLVDDTVALFYSSSSSKNADISRNLLKLLDKVSACEKAPLVLMHAAGRFSGLFSLLKTSSLNKNKAAFFSLFDKCFGAFARTAEELGEVTKAEENPKFSQLRPVCFGVILGAYDALLAAGVVEEVTAAAAASTTTAVAKSVVTLARLFQAHAEAVANQVGDAENPTAIPPTDSNMLAIQLRFAVRFGAPAIFDKLWKFFCKYPDALVSRDIQLALCATRQENQYEMVIAETYTGNFIRRQLAHVLSFHLSLNATLAEKMLWANFQKHIDTIIARWGGGQFLIQMVVTRVGEAVSSTDAAAKEFEEFFQKHPIPNADMAMRRAVQDIQVRATMKGGDAAARLIELL